MPRRRQHKRPAFWWNSEISELRNSCKKQRRKAQRARESKRPEQEEVKYKDVRKLLRNAIKQRKRQCWKALCTDVNRDPWGTPYRLVIRKFQVSRGAVAPTDVPTVLKIVKGKNKDPKAPSSWRPLCMLDCTGKLHERMILNRVQSELDDRKNVGLSEMQYGFRAGRSTLNAVQEVQKSVDKTFSVKPKPGGFCAVVTLDVKNSFNTAIWEHMYQALNRRLPVYLMRVTSSYLEDRTLMVETDDGTKEIEITAGVAQGSVGGPTILNIHTTERCGFSKICG